MSIQNLAGTSYAGAYSFDKSGVKRQTAMPLSLFETETTGEKTASSSAKIAAPATVSGSTGINSTTAGTLWSAQNIAQSPESAVIDVEISDGEAPKAAPKTAADLFHEFMDKTPEEMMRDAIMKELGYTEESLEAMTPDERAAAEAEIASRMEEKIKESMRENTGIEVGQGALKGSVADLLMSA